jgi:hypothetical protein
VKYKAIILRAKFFTSPWLDEFDCLSSHALVVCALCQAMRDNVRRSQDAFCRVNTLSLATDGYRQVPVGYLSREHARGTSASYRVGFSTTISIISSSDRGGLPC